MKKSFLQILTIVLIAFSMSLLAACGGQKTEATQEETVAEATYACPMHPEVTGKQNDTCSKCGMALEKVEEEASAEHEHH